MELRFVKMNPTQNMTILVETPVERALQPELARRLMSEDSVCAEQVGYIEPASMPGAATRLQMMGGEFCGNASMSLAALLALRAGLSDGEAHTYQLEVSGADALVNCSITRADGGWLGEVDMPLPERAAITELGDGRRYPVVFFPGIAHVLVDEDEMNPEAAETLAPKWCRMLRTDALGVLLVDAAFTRMRPLVYVRASDSAVWERGCGSGTAAIAAWRAQLAIDGRADVRIAQPGGVISASAVFYGGGFKSIRIRGRVAPVAMGTAWVNGL